MARKFLLYLLCLLYIASTVSAINIIINGSWVINIDASDLQAGPGSDLISTYESLPSQITVRIQQSKKNDWEVDVKKEDINWPGQCHLYIRRTSNGVGSGWVAGGTDYLDVTSTDRTFFWGNSDRNHINVQLKVDGVSAQISVGVYTTYVYYTVIETF